MTPHQAQLAPAFSGRKKSKSHSLTCGVATATASLATLLFGISGCVTTPPPTGSPSALSPVSSGNSSPSPASTPLVTDSDAVFTELDQAAGLNGGYPLGHYIVSQADSAIVDLPDGMTHVGFVLKCTEPGIDWKVTVGNDDSRWVSGTCAENFKNTTGLFAIQSTDNGQVAVAITAAGTSPVFVVVFASH